MVGQLENSHTRNARNSTIFSHQRKTLSQSSRVSPSAPERQREYLWTAIVQCGSIGWRSDCCRYSKTMVIEITITSASTQIQGLTSEWLICGPQLNQATISTLGYARQKERTYEWVSIYIIYLINRLVVALLPYYKSYTRLSNKVLTTIVGRLLG